MGGECAIGLIFHWCVLYQKLTVIARVAVRGKPRIQSTSILYWQILVGASRAGDLKSQSVGQARVPLATLK